MITRSRCHRSLLRCTPLPAGLTLPAARPTHPTRTERRKTKEPPRAIEPGETVTHWFAADGQGHPSAQLALNERHRGIRPAGTDLSAPTPRCRIAAVPQTASGGRPFAITRPNRIAFRLDPRFAAEIKGGVGVEIQRLK